jgi:hypothetical protein
MIRPAHELINSLALLYSRLKMKKESLFVIICCLILIPCKGQSNSRKKNFPERTEYVQRLPGKQNFWIFLLAGQSNMAGRGFVEPSDTIPSSRIMTLNSENEWVYAKEPLHFYEPSMSGLDCGLSFGKELIKHLNDSIIIGLVPCAVGGSSTDQWLGDSLHRGVMLLSNFRQRTRIAAESGTLKGILWHQGEDNANELKFKNYRHELDSLFSEFRITASNDNLPILAGELASFLDRKKYGSYPDSVNKILNKIAAENKNVFIIKTADLKTKGDYVHFDSESQRIMGRRFAEKYIYEILR